MAERIVDRFEVVEIDEHDRHRPQVAPVQIERVREPVVEQRAVGQPGQRVVEGTVGQFGLLRHDVEREPAVVEHHDQLP